MKLTCQKLLQRSVTFFVFLIFLLQCSDGFAQNTRLFKGVVTDGNGAPVAGASVTVKGSGQGVSTGNDGSFAIEAAEGASVVVSSVGYGEKEIKLKGNTPLSIEILNNASTLNDVVVVGYGTQRKKDLTGSVAVVKVDDAKKTVSYDVAKMLQGQAAGISVQGSGEPGGFVQIKIRGTSTFSNNSPLFVIDGVPVSAPFDFNPGDIESIQVLKDASAGAIYGARAATGVVIITTKKGKSGPPKINYNGTYGWQEIGKRIPVLGREGYQEIVRAAETNAGLAIAPGNDPSSPLYIKDVNTDWQDEMFKTGIIQDHNVSLSGGSDAASYNVSLGYFDQTSTITGPQKYNRYTFNSNFQGKKGRFNYGGKLAYSQSHKVGYGNTNGHAVFGGAVNSMLTAIPTMPVYDKNRLGGYGGSDNVIQRAITLNVVGLNNLVNDYNDRNRLLGNMWGEFELAKNLKYKLSVSYDRTDFQDGHFEPKFDLGFYYLNPKFIMSETNGEANTKLAENTLSYLLQVNKHKFDFLAGYTFQEDHFNVLTGTATDTTDLPFKSFANISANAKGLTSYTDAAALLSYLGRFNYNYDGRYLLTANFRRDGSSRFSPLNRYGNFGSIALAWNVSDESLYSSAFIYKQFEIKRWVWFVG